jgi:hypothetical protein
VWLGWLASASAVSMGRNAIMEVKMCKTQIKHLFDCTLCGSPVTNETANHCVENTLCEECNDEMKWESMSQFLPPAFCRSLKP